MMTDPGIIAVRIRRGNIVFHIHGIDAGREGVWLAKGQVQGIYEAPVKSTWKTGAFQRGATHKAVKWMYRDINLGFHIRETSDTFEWNESMFRQVFFYEEDRWSENPLTTTIEIDTQISGTRKIDVLMYEEPDFTAPIDPVQQQYGNLILKLRAGQPYWYEDAVTATFTSASTSSSGTISISNPTDLPMWPKWVVTPATWAIPDVQWVGDPGLREPGGDQGDRMVEDITITEVNGGAVIDTDRQELTFRDLNNTNIQGQLGGSKLFNYEVPPYTPVQDVPIGFSAAPAGGATCQLIQPRMWTRPYGLEGATALSPALSNDITIRFSYPGTFEFKIPDWCNALDIVCVGGGGGGEGGGLLLTGSGGDASSWAYTTVVRGVGIPTGTYFITGVVGDGGRGGRGVDISWNWDDFSNDYGGGTDGETGQDTTVTATGMTPLESGGGAGGTTGAITGAGLADLEFNGKTYLGCDTQDIAGRRGNHPGGGGAGGWPLIGAGGKGGRGQVWIRAYVIEFGIAATMKPATAALTGQKT